MSTEKKQKTTLKLKSEEKKADSKNLNRYELLNQQEPEFLYQTAGSKNLHSPDHKKTPAPPTENPLEHTESFLHEEFCLSIKKTLKNEFVLVLVPGTVTSILRRALELTSMSVKLSQGLVMAFSTMEIGVVTFGGAFLTDMLMRIGTIRTQQGETLYSALQTYISEDHWRQSIKTGVKFFGHAIGWEMGYTIAGQVYHSPFEITNILVSACSAAIGTTLPTLATVCYDREAKSTIVPQLIINLFEGFFRSIIVDSHLSDKFLNKGYSAPAAKAIDAFSVGCLSFCLYGIGIFLKSISMQSDAPEVKSYTLPSSDRLSRSQSSIQQNNTAQNRNIIQTLCYGIWDYLKKCCCPVEAADNSEVPYIAPENSYHDPNFQSVTFNGVLPGNLSYTLLPDTPSSDGMRST